MPLDFNSGVDFVDQNIRYMDDLYALYPDRFDAWRDWCAANLINAVNTYTIPTGKVIMAGTWNGDLYSLFQAEYGSDNCVGFDIVTYYTDAHDSIIYGDFRDIHGLYGHNTAIFYNGLGTWEHNTTSKQAGLDYALTNLVAGGIYLEPYTIGAANKLATVDGLESLEINDSRLIIYRKI